jgi:hypothetical protein
VGGGGLGFAVDFGVGGCHGFWAGDLGGASAMVQLFQVGESWVMAQR